MDEKQIKLLIKDFRLSFKKRYPNSTDEEIDHMILDVFFQAYCEDKMDRHDLTVLTDFLGYEVVDDVLDEIEKEKKGGK